MSRERREQIKDFAALGKAFEVEAVVQPVAQERGFYELSVMRKLRACDTSAERRKTKAEKRDRKANAIASALTLNKKDRANQGIHVVVIGEVDEDNNLIKQESNQIGSKVHVVFPQQGKQELRFLSIADDLLLEHEDITQADLMKYADEVRTETDIDRQNRLRLKIKKIDASIGDQKGYANRQKFIKDYAPLQVQVTTRKSTSEMERLNREKTITVNEFLKTSLAIAAVYPGLKPQFEFGRQTNDRLHLELQMRIVEERSILRRLMDPTVSSLVRDGRDVWTTNISTRQLTADYKQYIRSRVDAPDHVRAGAETYELLQQLVIKE